MSYRNGNYTAFYVAEPFCESSLGVYSSKDFCYYNLLKAWKAKDSSFPFNDSHNKTYNVRDDSDWEKTLKPRLHKRLDNSKNLILFLSSYTKNSKALREEIDYAINKKGLPIIVIYPELKKTSDIVVNYSFTESIIDLWNKLPVFRDNKYKVPVIHIPMNQELIKKTLNDTDFMVNTKKGGEYYYY